MPLYKTTNAGNPHIGLFARATDKLAAADISSPPKFLTALAALGAPILKTTFGGSGLAGIYLAMNSHGAVVPSFCTNEEMGALKSFGLNVISLPGAFCAAGNNIAANDFGCVANPAIQKQHVKRISDCLGVEVVQRTVAGYQTAGSCVLATNRGFIAHNRCGEAELKELSSILKVQGSNCTLNTGVAFVSLGAIANSRAAIFGESSTGFEMGRAATALELAD